MTVFPTPHVEAESRADGGLLGTINDGADSVAAGFADHYFGHGYTSEVVSGFPALLAVPEIAQGARDDGIEDAVTRGIPSPQSTSTSRMRRFCLSSRRRYERDG